MWKDFKAFALKGNVIDMAVGVIIGGAFGKIVTSLVNDIIMPLVGLLTGNINYSNMFLLLGSIPDGETVTTLEDATRLDIPTLNYGAFITQVIDFIIMAFAIFMFIKIMTRITKMAETVNIKKVEPVPKAAPTTRDCPYCKSSIAIGATRCPHCTSQL